MTKCKDCGDQLSELNWWVSWRDSNNQRCIPCGRSQNRRNDSPEKSRNRMLKRKYGITLKEYDLIFDKQGGLCYLCGTSNPGGPPQTKNFCVDHCHKEGHIRHLLCNDCNSGLGFFNDNPLLLRRAANYLEEDYDK